MIYTLLFATNNSINCVTIVAFYRSINSYNSSSNDEETYRLKSSEVSFRNEIIYREKRDFITSLSKRQQRAVFANEATTQFKTLHIKNDIMTSVVVAAARLNIIVKTVKNDN